MADPTGLHRRVDRRRALVTIGGLGLMAAVGPAACSSSSSSKSSATTSAPHSTRPAAPATTSSPTAQTSAPNCTLSPELSGSSTYLDLEKVRRDITEGKPGVPLTFRATVLDRRTCTPINQAAVDLWHCDAAGDYSGQQGSNTTFLRGVQLTGPDGVAEFTSIYPGWYQDRAVHIHVKVHVGGSVQAGGAVYRGGHVSHTGQLFFPDATNSAVAALAPYSDNQIARTSDSADTYFRQGSGSGLATVTPHDPSDLTRGVTAQVSVVVDPTATPPAT